MPTISRRAFASGTSLAALAVVPASAQCVLTDPAYAAIRRHKDAYAAAVAAVTRNPDGEIPWDTVDQAADALAATLPTTAPGAAAILRYAYEFEEREDAGIWIDNGHEMHKHLADALGSFGT
jgi:hypothetical protein